MYFDLWPADEDPLRSLMPASARSARFYRHLLLWVLQGWLAMFYIGAAAAKLTQHRDILSSMLQWPARVDPGFVQLIGWTELGLAIGVLAPLASWPIFRPALLISAAGLFCEAIVMGGYHAIAGQGALAAVNGTLAALAAVVLIGRRFSGDRAETRA
jgi:hypothetical protein